MGKPKEKITGSRAKDASVQKRGGNNRKDSHPKILVTRYKWVRGDVGKYESKVSNEMEASLLQHKLKFCLPPYLEQLSIEPCSSEERIFFKVSTSPPHVYMYQCLFRDLGVVIPFTPFEFEFLKKINVAPSQLHPNSWGFVLIFQILCSVMGIKLSLGVFMHFYQIKLGEPPFGWVSLSGSSNVGLFQIFLQSYKKFKEEFFKVQSAHKDATSDTIFHLNGEPKFPLSWKSQPIRFYGSKGLVLSAAEKKDIEKLEVLARPLESKAILLLAGSKNPQDDLESIMGQSKWRELKAKYGDKDVETEKVEAKKKKTTG
ncbi:uncharacterized protein LOC109788159 [Cajanus cajan]|uniref:uncharacterized protein LOC109788159 n=1 Tax=Cajanus cajan TaxID=3821 RepID=UPI0010FB8E50|nr:uncharacterized protein LOC109788159 [Cajanus cajan]